ncbi:MAG: hypothetical protein M1822_005409 [Bathelium mastoideum]|nr:MAG: hypothetical protein M1822_005409 [Bathelium mastoideum]
MNHRRLERWHDVDSPNFKCHWRHSFVRRCASFWSNQCTSTSGWDGKSTQSYTVQTDFFTAVMLVDPAFDSFLWDRQVNVNMPLASTILQDPSTHARLDSLWAARNRGFMIPTRDTSVAYHGGSQTLTESTLSLEDAKKHPLILSNARNLSSLLDETVIHWTKIAKQDLILSARECSVNSAHYLLKYVANLWVHQLDLVQSTIAQSEYFSEDYQAKADLGTSSEEWRRTMLEVHDATTDMNHLRRQMLHFEHHMTLNLERLGIVMGAERIDSSAPDAIQDAQKDFLHLYTRLRPFVARAMALDKTANDLASLHANFKSIQHSELGLKLSVFASIVFPATLVSSVLSMGNEFLPGQGKFWVFWAVSVPVVFSVAISLVFTQQMKTWLFVKVRKRD